MYQFVVPFGEKYRGLPLENCPIEYLNWMYVTVPLTAPMQEHILKLLTEAGDKPTGPAARLSKPGYRDWTRHAVA